MQWHFRCCSVILFGHDKCGLVQLFIFTNFSVWYHKNFPGASTSTAHLTSTSQPNTTTTSVNLTTQPTKTSQTVTPTTASPVTSAQANITVVTTSKTSSTSVTGEFAVQELIKAWMHVHMDCRTVGFTAV